MLHKMHMDFGYVNVCRVLTNIILFIRDHRQHFFHKSCSNNENMIENMIPMIRRNICLNLQPNMCQRLRFWVQLTKWCHLKKWHQNYHRKVSIILGVLPLHTCGWPPPFCYAVFRGHLDGSVSSMRKSCYIVHRHPFLL